MKKIIALAAAAAFLALTGTATTALADPWDHDWHDHWRGPHRDWRDDGPWHHEVIIVPRHREVFVGPAFVVVERPVVHHDTTVVIEQQPTINAVPTSDVYQNESGQYCREYQTTIIIGGETKPAYGTACLQPDGSWQKAD